MRKAYADIPDGQMHYRHAGSGSEAVILLHMSGSSSEEYAGVVDPLAAEGYDVYAPDLLGFGPSDKPTHYYYSMEEHVNTLISFMDALGIEKAYFYGNLATSNMAVHLAAKYPERVKGLLLAYPLYNANPEHFKRRGHTPGFCKVDPTDDGSFLQELWKRSHKYGDPCEVSDRRCADLHLAGEWGETLHWALHDDRPIAYYAAQLSVKTVFIGYSFFANSKDLNDLVKLVPGAEYDFYDHAAAYLARTEPLRVVGMVVKHFPVK